jgi:hypothetical protein
MAAMSSALSQSDGVDGSEPARRGFVPARSSAHAAFSSGNVEGCGETGTRDAYVL